MLLLITPATGVSEELADELVLLAAQGRPAAAAAPYEYWKSPSSWLACRLDLPGAILSALLFRSDLIEISRMTRLLLKQAHLIWVVSILNIGIGFAIPGFDPLTQVISEVALEAPAFAYTHRVADIVIGLAMCGFGVGLSLLSRGQAPFSLLANGLLGASFISAGIWTMASPLHLLYNLSIFMIVVPMTCALELKSVLASRQFERLCLAVSFVHVLMFWCINAGFVPDSIDGLVQRAWSAVLMGWFGIAAHWLLQRSRPALHTELTSREGAVT